MDVIRLGFGGIVNAYLLRAASGHILVDTGLPGAAWRLFQLLRRHGSSPEQLRLVIISHAHFDHIGGLAELRQRCAAPVLVHRLDEPVLRSGQVVFPAGQNRLARALMGLGSMTVGGLCLGGCDPDIVVDDTMDLQEFGVPGRLIHTPGHTRGSVSLVLENGDAVVGDLCQNGFGFGMGMGAVIPPLADEPMSLAPSFRRVLSEGARRIHPGHGVPFEAEYLKAALQKLG